MEDCDYVSVGKGLKKEARNSIRMVSNLRKFIELHFNFPRPQVTLGEDGCVVITGLYDGIPNDIEIQDHERFDHMLKLFSWMEGRIELPTNSEEKTNDYEQQIEEVLIDEPFAMEEISN